MVYNLVGVRHVLNPYPKKVKFNYMKLLVAALISFSAALSAATVPVFGTGYVAGGPGLGGVGTVDGNFSLISCPAGEPCASNGSGGYNAFITLTGQYPFTVWTPNTGTGQWIGPALGGNEITLDAPGVYEYQETFDLTGFDLSTVALSGSYATDNSGYFELNGVTVGSASSSFSSLTAISLTSGFNQGTNTLDFFVTNAPPGGGPQNPTGLFVELSGTGNLLAAPEPASIAFVGLGLVALGVLGSRRRS